MQVMDAKTIDDAVLVSSNVPENDHPAFDAETTYPAGEYCVVPAVHRIYKSLVDSNLGKYPPDNSAGTNPAWLEISYTNQRKMFDPYVGTLTVNPGSIQVVLNSSRCDTLAVFNAIGSTALVEQLIGETVVWSQEIRIINECKNWYDYFFGEITFKRDFFARFPIYGAGSSLRLTISGTTASCGNVVLGRLKFIGDTVFDLNVGVRDFSRAVTDENFGITYLQKGAWAKRGEFAVDIENHRVDDVFAMLESLRATPTVYFGDNEGPFRWRCAQIFGFVKDFAIVIPNPAMSTCSIEVTGLI